MVSRMDPGSCDTFVVLPPNSDGGRVTFGKNSDRPADEVQEIVHQPSADHSGGDTVQCTYIEIPQAAHTYAVILSKPSWMWGAEMGANECGVCIGNEAVWTVLNGPEDEVEKLLGMDLVRLGLERGETARKALDVIVNLLEAHGQGGPCSDSESSFTYHNSFLIADAKEAWVLETAGSLWAAEQVISGCRNISNQLTIGTKIDLMASGLKDHAQKEGYWDGQGEFSFSGAYGEASASANHREKCGRKLLEKYSAGGNFKACDMFKVLRDDPSGICMRVGAFVSTSSQVSVLSPADSQRPSCHWFTGTPDPQLSVFKPFIFCPGVRISPHIQSPKLPPEEDPAKMQPRFKKQVDRAHNLYSHHKKAMKNKETVLATLRQMETTCLQETEAFLKDFHPDKYVEVQDLFKDVVESELKFYK